MKRTLLAIVAAMMITVSASAQNNSQRNWRSSTQVECCQKSKKPSCKSCNKTSKKDKKKLDKKRKSGNNSPEAIRMRQEMRRGVMKGAR